MNRFAFVVCVILLIIQVSGSSQIRKERGNRPHTTMDLYVHEDSSHSTSVSSSQSYSNQARLIAIISIAVTIILVWIVLVAVFVLKQIRHRKARRNSACNLKSGNSVKIGSSVGIEECEVFQRTKTEKQSKKPRVNPKLTKRFRLVSKRLEQTSGAPIPPPREYYIPASPTDIPFPSHANTAPSPPELMPFPSVGKASYYIIDPNNINDEDDDNTLPRLPKASYMTPRALAKASYLHPAMLGKASYAEIDDKTRYKASYAVFPGLAGRESYVPYDQASSRSTDPTIVVYEEDLPHDPHKPEEVVRKYRALKSEGNIFDIDQGRSKFGNSKSKSEGQIQVPRNFGDSFLPRTSEVSVLDFGVDTTARELRSNGSVEYVEEMSPFFQWEGFHNQDDEDMRNTGENFPAPEYDGIYDNISPRHRSDLDEVDVYRENMRESVADIRRTIGSVSSTLDRKVIITNV
eukprot:m.343559 g.343559  ORF g.343559 m.343559 type:complete len:461 (+) comp23006_c0_seq1:59-1441(+)